MLVMYNVSNERVSWRNGCLSKLAFNQPPKSLLSRDSAHVLEKAGETFGICPPHTSHTGERIYSGQSSVNTGVKRSQFNSILGLGRLKRATEQITASASCVGVSGFISPHDRQGSTGPEYAIHGSTKLRVRADASDTLTGASFSTVRDLFGRSGMTGPMTLWFVMR